MRVIITPEDRSAKPRPLSRVKSRGQKSRYSGVILCREPAQKRRVFFSPRFTPLVEYPGYLSFAFSSVLCFSSQCFFARPRVYATQFGTNVTLFIVLLFVEFHNHAFPVTEQQLTDIEDCVSRPDSSILNSQQLSDEFDSMLLEGWTTPDTTTSFAERMQLAVDQLRYMTRRFRQPSG